MNVSQALGVGLAAICVAAVLVALARLPRSRVSQPLLAFAVSGALWGFGDLLAGAAPDPLSKQVAIAVLYTGAIYMPTLWWLLVLRWSSGRNTALPFDVERWSRLPLVWATTMWLAMLTNPWHGWFLTPVLGDRNVYGPLWWVMALPNYCLIVAAFWPLMWVVTHFPARAVRRQGALMMCASLVTLLGNWVYVLGPARTVNATLIVLGASSALLLVGMYREGLFGLLPVALPVIADRDPDGLLVLRPGGGLAYANARAREILASLDLPDDARLPESFAGRFLETSGHAISEAEGWEASWWKEVLAPGGSLFCMADDRERWIHMTAQVVRGRGAQISALCVRLRDVSEERRVEVELSRARRLESVADLARGIAHDFRNVLAIIQGNAELLATDLDAQPRLQRQADRILEAGQQARELADQLQLYAGGVDPRRVKLDLSEMASQIVELRAPTLGETTRVDIALAADPLVVEADPTQLRQAVLNLWTNALEATRETGAEIRLSTGRRRVDPAHVEHLVSGREAPPGEYAWVRVADAGPGMDAEVQERIFDPFFSTKGKHRGVGLSTVIGVARAHSAPLELETHPGRGSAFTLYFPVEGDSACGGGAAASNQSSSA